VVANSDSKFWQVRFRERNRSVFLGPEKVCKQTEIARLLVSNLIFDFFDQSSFSTIEKSANQIWRP